MLAATLVVTALGGCSGDAMAKLTLFSAVQGRVLEAGRPVEGATVEREYRWSWKDQVAKDSVLTDARGEFRFGAVEAGSFLGSLLPHNINVRQIILIHHAGKTHKAWVHDKVNYRPEGELGRPISLTCRLESEPTRRGNVFGICEYD